MLWRPIAIASPAACSKYTGGGGPWTSWRAPSHAALAPSAMPAHGPARLRCHVSWAENGAPAPSPSSAKYPQNAARPAGTTASHAASRRRARPARHASNHNSPSGTTSSSPALRVAAPSAPSAAASAQRSWRAASTAPTDTIKNSDSE